MAKSKIVKSFCILHFDFYLLTFTILIWALLPHPVFSAGTVTKGSQKSLSAFIENKGQIIDQKNIPNAEVLYLLNSPGFNVQLRRGGFSYDVYQVGSQQSAVGGRQSAIDSLHLVSGIRHPASDIENRESSIQYHRVDFDLLNANSNPTIVTSDPSRDYENYHTPGTPEKGVSFVRHYKTITYKNIYPNIDLEFLTDEQKGFKYNFVVYPGGDLSAIRMKIAGPEIELSTSGSLFLKTTLGTIEEEIPDCKFKQNDIETMIACQFKKISTDVFGFSLQNEIPYNSTITIDPLPQRLWGTYYGGTSNTACYGGTADADSNVIICGLTNSSNYIATAGAFQTTLHDEGENAFLAKFSTNGEIVWATYYGGFGTQGNACVTDHAKNIFLFGVTISPAYIATAGSYQTIYAGGNDDCFLVKFTPAGQRVWGTYYGGSGHDQGLYCNIDNMANILVTGNTTSNNGIATPGAFKTSKSGYDDTFLAKFDSTGTSLLWGTYYGGSSIETGFGIATDTNLNIYFAGETNSSDGISTTGSLQPIIGGAGDGFLVKFSPSGQRIWGTYYGGSSEDEIFWDGISKNSELYISGQSMSTNNIATTGSYQPSLHGDEDAFLAKFDTNGNRLWGTYFGGDSTEWGARGAINDSGYIYIDGSTESSNLIATPDAFLSTYIAGYYSYLAKFNPMGERVWGTYFGDTMETASGSAGNLAAVGNRILYLTGSTHLLTYCATPGAYQTFNRDPKIIGNPFIEKFYDCRSPDTANQIIGSLSVCKNDSGIVYSIIPINYATGYHWTVPPGFLITTGQNTHAITIKVLNTAVSGNVSVWGTNYCGNGVSDSIAVTVHDATVPVITGSDTVCQNTQTTYHAQAGMSNYQWALSPGGTIIAGGTSTSDSVTLSWTVTGVNWAEVNFTNSFGCKDSLPSQFNVWVNPAGIASVGITTPSDTVCPGTLVCFTATPVNGGSPPDFQWKINGIHYGINSPVFCYPPANGDTIYCILTSNQSCVTGSPAISNKIRMTVLSELAVSVSISASANPFCMGSSVTFTAIPTNGGTAPAYQWKVNGVNVVGNNNPVFTYTPANSDCITCSLTSNLACATGNPATSNTICMTADPNFPVSVSINVPANPVCAGTQVIFTATPTNGGTTPAYQWKVNGVIAGGNSPVLIYVPSNADCITCTLTSNLTCATGNPATSNVICMTVNPNLPVSITITASENPVCAGTQVTFTANPTNPGTLPIFQWKVNGIIAGTNNPIYLYTPLNGDVVTCILTSNAICPIGNPATSDTITMIVNPNLSVSISISASNNPVCSGIPVTFTATPANGGPTPIYHWKVNGIIAGTNNPTYIYTPVTGDLVSCELTSSLPCTTNNPATSNAITMNISALPVVTFTRCNDSITTTNAQPFKLKGGIPLGGTYSGAGVTNGIFYPAIAGPGNHQITYTYTNAALCSASGFVTIVTIVTTVTTCGQILTDIRDGNTYSTVQIGSQCWMAANLNYGTLIPGNMSQRDNCIPEKYCYNDITGNCQLGTANYQWDEIMQYDEIISNQGLCPPGWHIPTEVDWNTLFDNYISNAFAASPLLFSGFSGFNALLSGARHINKSWDFRGFATFFWSSTYHGTNKAWAHGMNDVDPSVSAYPALRSNAFSVRCLKD